MAQDTTEFRVSTLFHSVVRDFFATAPGTALRGWRLANLKQTLFKIFNSLSYFNVINSPDSLEFACDFSSQSLVLPQYHTEIQSLPNFDLGAAPGGNSCIVIFTTAPQLSWRNNSFRVAPNPVSDFLNIICQSNEDALLELFDLYGKRVGAISLFHYFKNRLLNVSELPPGVYLAAVSCQGERVWSEKVVVQR